MKNAKYLILAAAIFIIDMHIKNRVEKWTDINDGETKERKYITLSKHHNRGLPMNIADSYQDKVAKASLIVTLITTVFYFYVLRNEDKPLLKTGLSLQMGGACSNTYDRLKRKYVVDYFSFNVKGKLGGIVFNLADMAIFGGSLLTTLNAIFVRSNSHCERKESCEAIPPMQPHQS
jgi:signal peptidase II